MSKDILAYNKAQPRDYRAVCDLLYKEISSYMPESESKIWHGHPVWFIESNPIVGFSIQKSGVRLMFWSGADFDDPNLQLGTGKFKDASIFYTAPDQVNADDLQRWLEKSKTIQWDYKNIVKHKGVLERLK